MVAGTKGGGAAKAAAGKGALASDAKKRAAADPFAFHGDRTAEEHHAILSYQAEGYLDINAHLRGPEPGFVPGAEYVAHIPHLDTLMGKIRTAKPIVVHRGVKAYEGFDPATLVPGSTYTDKGFFSTSHKKTTARNFARGEMKGGAVFHVSLPAGTRAIPAYRVGHQDLFQGEREVLLPRGSTVRVRKVIKVGKIYHAYGELQ